ncbi:MAG: aminotransferase class I/II-fold pyridoxal phosphate-dependent enzyme [Evtepia sp.]
METILQKLIHHSETGPLSLHMPGHKRNLTLAPYLECLGAQFDISEIDGFDDLHAPTGIIKESMESAAKLWNSQKTFFSVNGSTAGILSGIRAATKRGDTVVVARNCHKSIYHALELCDLRPIFLAPPLIEAFGCAAAIPPQDIEAVLSAHDDVKLLILTSPTYDGIISDIFEISKICHAKKVPVLVDEAHGAHLGFHAAFLGGAVKAGADLVVQSLHKTLPSLTQTAIVHLNSDRIDDRELARQLAIFQSSSPSYLFLASIDSCIHLIETEGTALFDAWNQYLTAFACDTKSLQYLRILGSKESVFRDKSKIVISTRQTRCSGGELVSILRNRYGLELEMSLEDYAVAMTGLGEDGKALKQLATALCQLDMEFGCERPAKESQMYPIPKRRISIASAVELPHESKEPADALGETSAGYLWAYPPGIPLITPGEVVDATFLEHLSVMRRAGVHILPDTFYVVRD